MVKKHFEEGSDTRPDWGNYDMPVHIACVLIKMVFRELPQPVFPAAVYERLERIHAEAADSARQSAIAALICDCLDVPTCLFLAYILQLMVDVARAADVTRMTAANLAVVLAPNLLRSDDPVRDLMVGPAAACVVRSWITHWDDFYKQRFAPNNIARQSQ